MKSHNVRVLAIDSLTHDVLQIRTEKPGGYEFVPGQATEVSIRKEYWEKEKRPFSFTGLPGDGYLEFIIKTYPAHHGLTNQLQQLKPGEELVINEVWGAIRYEGPGIFIAGGAGITPFISIFRQLARKSKIRGNRLIYANKRKADIILENELKSLLGDDMINVLSEELLPSYRYGFVNREILSESLEGWKGKVYVCGPPVMMDTVLFNLSELGVGDHSIVAEI